MKIPKAVFAILALAMAMAINGRSQAAPVSFVLSSTIPLGYSPASIITADVNGDGKPDLITGNHDNNTLTVLTNNGQGGFAVAAVYAVGQQPFQVAVADVNGDGKVDLICANSDDNNLSVLTNDGKGGFVLSTTLSVGNHPLSVLAADLNTRGRPDLIAADYAESTLTVLTNDSHGGFSLAGTFPVGSGPYSVSTADVNGDGKPDLFTANQKGASVSVLTNDGHGGFVTSGTYAVDNGPNEVAAADVNGDGKPDLITANYNGGTLSILTNDGTGRFVLSSTVNDVFGVRSVEAADVNGDGSLDLVTVPGLNDTVTVFTNNGSGGFTMAASVTGPGSYPFWDAVADVNGDGKPDAICANIFGNSITVLTNATSFPPFQSFLTNGLAAYYPFNGNANDASGNGNNGTIHGGVTLAPDRFGNPNSAYLCNGTDGYIDVGNPVGNSPNYLTECAWVKIISRATNGYGPNDVIMTKRQDPSGLLPVYWPTLFISPGGNGVLAADGAFHETDCTSTTQTPTNVWVFLCGVLSNGNYRIYINGTLENTINDGIALDSIYNLYLMHDVSWGTFCDGVIDDVRIYNRALSSNEVAQLYAYESGADTNQPSIINQPQSVVANAGDNVAFSVYAGGTTPLFYQWLFNGSNILGATSSSLTISNIAQTDLGEYAVVVSNSFGSTNSADAMLSMYPFIETPFTGAVTYWGKDTTLSVEGWGTGPLHYQWFKDGVALLNATNQTLFLPAIQFTNAGLYSIVLSSPLGSVTNKPAQVVVNPAGISIGMYPGVIVSGSAGYTYTIQASSDLTNNNGWTTVATLTLIQPVQLWVDISVNALSPANPHKYYRVLPGP